jgi:hypothetical protein
MISGMIHPGAAEWTETRPDPKSVGGRGPAEIVPTWNMPEMRGGWSYN